MNATKTTKVKRQQTTEELRAAMNKLVEYQNAIERAKESMGIPESERDRWFAVFYDPARVTTAGLLKYHQKISALRPTRLAGRQAGKVYVSPDVALAVYEVKDRGMKWDKIARTVLNEPIPSDPAARERLRGKVRYLAGVGLRLSRKKK